MTSRVSPANLNLKGELGGIASKGSEPSRVSSAKHLKAELGGVASGWGDTTSTIFSAQDWISEGIAPREGAPRSTRDEPTAGSLPGEILRGALRGTTL